MGHHMNSVDRGLDDPRTPPDFRCIECGAKPRLTGGQEIYPHRRDLYTKKFYVCDNCPSSYCGCHPETTTPLGYPCGPKTRRARGHAHSVIDPIWRDKLATRREVYHELAKRLDVPNNECHVAWMTADDAFVAAKIAQIMRDFYEERSRDVIGSPR